MITCKQLLDIYANFNSDRLREDDLNDLIFKIQQEIDEEYIYYIENDEPLIAIRFELNKALQSKRIDMKMRYFDSAIHIFHHCSPLLDGILNIPELRTVEKAMKIDG